MTTTYKVLGQVNPSATTATTLYTAPGGTQAIVSTLSICNQGISTTFRVSVRPAGATADPKHYIVYDAYINANDSTFLTLGLTLTPSDVITVYAGTATVSFGLFGSEIV
jgi:hypothetical protein